MSFYLKEDKMDNERFEDMMNNEFEDKTTNERFEARDVVNLADVLIKDTIIRTCKKAGIEGAEMLFKRNYKGKTLQKIMYYYDDLIGGSYGKGNHHSQGRKED